MAYGLLARILDTGFERGYWQKGSIVADCFGGIGSTGILGASRGLRVIMVELEENFCTLAKANFDLHRRTWEHFGDPLPVIVQGDSREFARIVGEVGGVVTSPPYNLPMSQSHPGTAGGTRGMESPDGGFCRYGDTPGQIEGLPAGSIDAAIMSPPYAETMKGDHGETETAEESRAKRKTPGGSLGQSQRHGGYGATEGQIGALKEGSVEGVITSPPYAEGKTHPSLGHPELDGKGHGDFLARATTGTKPGSELYGTTPGNIGNLKSGEVDGCITSPPYQKSLDNIMPRSKDGKDGGAVATFRRTGKWPERRPEGMDYGSTAGQIGSDKPEDYWRAMKTVYEQVFLALKPGGVMACVVKSYVSKGKIVDLPSDTCRLLESLGFDVFERTRAWLVKHEEHPSLFGGVVAKTTSRKSFFRRLCESKGAPPIDWEEVLWARK